MQVIWKSATKRIWMIECNILTYETKSIKYQILMKCIDLEKCSLPQHLLWGEIDQSTALQLIPGLVVEDLNALHHEKGMEEIRILSMHFQIKPVEFDVHQNSTTMGN